MPDLSSLSEVHINTANKSTLLFKGDTCRRVYTYIMTRIRDISPFCSCEILYEKNVIILRFLPVKVKINLQERFPETNMAAQTDCSHMTVMLVINCII